MGMRWRSLLFVPAHDERRIAKAAERGADAIILDLEDAVPTDLKAHARAALPAAIEVLAGQQVPLVVRINQSWMDTHADLEAAVVSGVAAIMVPKVEAGWRLQAIRGMIVEIVARRNLPSPDIIALIESPEGIEKLREIAAIDGVVGLALGSEDFSLALGVDPGPASLDLPCRMLALAAAPRGLMALGLPVSIATIEDGASWEEAAARARAVGITGGLCIHPKQIAPLNRAFSPSEAQVLAAERLLAAWDAAGAAGVIKFEGRMVDLPVVLAARRTIEIGGKRG